MKMEPTTYFDDDLTVILSCELFTGMTADDLRRALSCFGATLIHRHKGEMVAVAGSSQAAVGLVVQGQVQVQKEDYDGNRLILAVFGPGHLFGEVSAFAGPGRWLNHVRAREDCRLLMLPVRRLNQPCQNRCFVHERLTENMLSIVAQRALSLNRRIDYLKRKGMREKLSAYLYDQYRKAGSLTFMLDLDREGMADYLNVSRPSMSRELGRMKKEGIIDFYRKAFTVRDIKALRQKS